MFYLITKCLVFFLSFIINQKILIFLNVKILYSFYINREDGEYESALPGGKRFAFVTSQGHPDPERFKKPIRWLGGMVGGLGLETVGKIVHVNSLTKPASEDHELLATARQIGRKLLGHG